MKLKSKLLITVLSLLCAASAGAQELWLNAEAKYSITKKLKADIEIEHRSRNHFEASSRWSGSVGLSYKLLPWLSASASYKFLRDYDEGKVTKKGNIVAPYRQYANRAQIGLTGSLKLGKFELSLREAYQYTHFNSTYANKYDSFGNPKDDERIEGKDRNLLRSKIEAEYKHKKKCLVTPFASVEVYNDFSDSFSARKVRYTAGADFRIDKHNSISAFYRFVQRMNSANSNVIGVSYQFKF